MAIGVRFFNRDFSDYIGKHWDAIEVKRYTTGAIGGSLQGGFDVYGSEEDIWKFVEMLRCPVRFYDEEMGGKDVWWGYIDKVDIYSTSGIRYGVDVDTMSNRIAVAYSYNYERETTGWGSDMGSRTEYGTKELLMSASDQTAEQALQYRANRLEALKYPIRQPITFGGARDKAFARIRCLGWIATVAWKYYANDSGKISFEKIDASDPGYLLGNGLKDYCAQSFKSTSTLSWNITTCALRIRRTYGVYDYVEYRIKEDAGGVPGDVVATCDVVWNYEMEDDGFHWYERDLDTPLTVNENDVYWIEAARRDWDSNDTEAHWYYMSAEYGGGYPDGKFLINKLPNALPWGWEEFGQEEGDEGEEDYVPYPDMAMHFRLVGESETTQQIASIVSAAEFITDYEIVDTTGVMSYPFRDGESLALYELEELLRIGTASNLRLIVDINKDRVLRIYEEPTVGVKDYSIDNRGVVRDPYNNEIHSAGCPVGYWAQLRGIIPASVDVTQLAGGAKMFVEQAEYNATTGVYRVLQARDSSVVVDALEELRDPEARFSRREKYSQG